MFNTLVFMFSVVGASPFFLWSSRHTLGRIMPELLGSTPLLTVLRCFVVCITLLRAVAAFASAPSGFSMLTRWWSQLGKGDTVGSLGYGISKLFPPPQLYKGVSSY